MPFLTKSRFKIALECPTQLYYNDNDQYANQSIEDNFLKELAKGGFQVGALARCYYPEGILIDTRNHEQAFSETLALLQQKNVTIFEAAFLYQNCFIRADILVKKGNKIELIEVKSKSISPSENDFFNTKGGMKPEWQPYLYDIAFQIWVTRLSLQSVQMAYLQVTPFLMLANKEANASVEGLNQRFFYNIKTNRVEFDKSKVTPEKLGDEVLVKIKVSKSVQYLFEQPVDGITFTQFIEKCSEAVSKNATIWTDIGVKCKGCGFTADEEQKKAGELNGYHECFHHAGYTKDDLKKPMSWDIWDARKKEDWFASKKLFITDLTVDDLGNDKGAEIGMSRVQRQDIQRVKTINQDFIPHIDKDALLHFYSGWKFPYHCIDFETSMVALPFHKGMHPYEQILFQFSHHIINEDGSVIHKTECINTQPGHFPNFDIVRELKAALGSAGTIFRYAAHENTVLCQIHAQLSKSKEFDKKVLMNFIEGITTKKGGKDHLWNGGRSMVDLLKVVKSAYYSLYAGGSNSIKYILPAILNSSAYLQELYSKPIYGTHEMRSRNFREFTWIKKENGLVLNPYDLLEPIFSKKEDLMLDDLLMDEDAGIFDGGAAMAAYGMMQFTHMTDAERYRISKALLKYCELDTLAMVMILQEFKHLIS